MDLTVGDEKPPPYVQYHSGDASMAFVTADQQPSQEPPNKARGCRCTAVKSLGVAVTLCLITTVAALTLFFLQRADILPKVEHSKKADLPDVTNLDLVAADNHYLTVAWDRPRLSFDFYWLNVTGGFENGSGSLPTRTARACGNGTIIHPQQTQITCGPFDSCSSVDVTIRTYNKGPHELMSKGTTLSDIFIGGEDPSEPRSINVVAESPTLSRLKWQAPARFNGILDVYRVKVCEAFITCDDNQNTSYCVEYETFDESLNINTTEDSLYCILITSNAWCGRNVLTSLPAALEFRTPLFKLPDVFNLALVRVKMGYVTISWQRPRSRFDYYAVEVYENEDSGASAGHQGHRLCANGTIIRPDQTEATCGPFEPCTNLSFTVHTYLNGPPERRSPGATLTSIFIPPEDPIPATNVTMIPESPMRTRLQWGRPERETDLPDVTDLKLLFAGHNAVTVAWKKPEARFDYYWLSVSAEKDGVNELGTVGSCGNGTIIHPDQTRVTCMNLEPCDRVNITLRAHRNGPPVHTSRGVCLQDIFIPGKEPLPPRNVRIIPVSSTLTLLYWDYPDNVSSAIESYNVKICRTFRRCGPAENQSFCEEHVTAQTRLKFNSTADTPYCVLVSANKTCGIDKIRSQPAVAELRTPIFVAVRNLTVSYVGDDNFTLTWQKPEGCVDNYTVMVTDNSDRSRGNASNGLVSCNKGGVITSSQTSVTCDQPVLCANATISVKPNVRGAANNTLSGETLSGVLLPGKHPPPVTDLQLSVITHRYFEITYKAPKECYSDFGHRVSRASSNSRARLSYCRVQKTSSRITATCNITACGKINIGAQTMSTGPSRRGSLWAELFGLNTKKMC
ncbi:fibronectin-like isoform X2 [Rhipicephalus microplus]|uniref:fibronectin-like isoform X2 n=1 Tax=Rhipicephalus microplus TaxID=6941 RepID=UPI003F6A741B